MTITPSEYRKLADAGYNRIPLISRTAADLDTPVSVWAKLANTSGSYLFESVQGGEHWGRYSIIGLPARTFLRAEDRRVEIITDDEIVERHDDTNPLEFILQYLKRFRAYPLERFPRMGGGLAGYFGYETVQHIEPKLAENIPPDPLGVPDILLGLSEQLVIFDNLTGEMTLVVYADTSQSDAYDEGIAQLQKLGEQLTQNLPDRLRYFNMDWDDGSDDEFKPARGRDEYMRSVERIREYILAGDVMQVLLSERFSAEFSAEPLELYRALRRLNPSPYMYLLQFDDHAVVGSSPEVLVRCQDGKASVRPIAGTRRRGHTPEDDIAMEKDLINDPKEISEHLMLLDLARNDIGRIAKTGSVEVTEHMIVERFSHVMHLTSQVTGEMREEVDALTALSATFPAGTLSGAPKVRAMEIIAELEPYKRCIYGGAVGHIGWSGDIDLAIAIRTAVIKQQRLYIQAGGGIVADSKPELEWKEALNKARALFRAASLAQRNRPS